MTHVWPFKSRKKVPVSKENQTQLANQLGKKDPAGAYLQ
jgi:hypothetical protein